MKTLIMIRHVKSDWTDAPANDYDRPVSEDRKKDAVAVAIEIINRQAVPQLVIASPSVRTMQTAETICKEWKYPAKNVATDKKIYDATTADILTVIQTAPAGYDTLAIICHSPAIGDFTNQYSDAHIDHVPTSAAVCINFDVKEWKDVKDKGKLNWFLNPKELRRK